MSAEAAIRTAMLAREDAERGHRLRVKLAWLLALAVVLIIGGYGFNYYKLSAIDRPYSPKFDQLRPSGTIGIKLGMLGVFLFFLIHLYPLRKKWGWLARQGNSRHWLDFHVILGTFAPLIVAFHASFKFGNIAGMAFWSMLCVTLSGFVGARQGRDPGLCPVGRSKAAGLIGAVQGHTARWTLDDLHRQRSLVQDKAGLPWHFRPLSA